MNNEMDVALNALLSATTHSEIFLAAAEHPVLLSENCFKTLEELILLQESALARKQLEILLMAVKLIAAVGLQRAPETLGNEFGKWQSIRSVRSDGTVDGDATVDAFSFQVWQILKKINRPGVFAASLIGSIGFVAYKAGESGAQNMIETAIDTFEISLETITPATDLQAWVQIKLHLAQAYTLRKVIDLPTNSILAIRHFSNVIEQTRGNETNKSDWMRAHFGIGIAIMTTNSRARNTDKAIAHLKRALDLYEPDSDARYFVRARIYLGLAYVDKALDGLGGAEDAIATISDDVLQIERDPEILAMGLCCLGDAFALRTSGDPVRNIELSIDFFQRALDLNISNILLEGRILIGLGDAYGRRSSDIDKSHLQNAIQVYSSILDNAGRYGRIASADASNNIGNAYLNLLAGDRTENIEKAIEYFRVSFDLRSADINSPFRAQVANNLGVALYERISGDADKNVEEAIHYFLEALRTRKRRQNKGKWAETIANLGTAYSRRRRGSRRINLSRAMLCYRSAISVYDRDKDRVRWAETHSNLGLLLVDLPWGNERDNLNMAIKSHSEALTATSEHDDRRRWSEIATNLGFAYLKLYLFDSSGQTLHAGLKYLESLDLVESMIPPVRAIAILCNRAQIMLRLDEKSNALDILLRALSIYERAVNEVITPASRHALNRSISHVGRWLSWLYCSDGRYDQALFALESYRAISIRQFLIVDDALALPLDDAARDRLISARRRLALLRAEAAPAFGAEPKRKFSEIARDLREAEIDLSEAVVAAKGKPALEGISDVLDAIPAGSTLIVPVVTEFGSLIFVVPSGTVTLKVENVVFKAALSSRDTRSWLNRWNKVFQEGIETSIDQISTMMDALLRWLGQNIMGPALLRRSELSAYSMSGHSAISTPPELLLMPTGELALFPLHAALYENDRSGRSVLDDFVVCYTPSLTAHRTGTKRATSDNVVGHHSMLALINPANDLDLEFGENYEKATIERLFGGTADEVLVGAKGTKTALVNGVSGRTHLHFCCHGRFDASHPDWSGLELAHLKWLTMQEIVATLDLDRCQWAMLAACKTGMSDVDESPEEVIGLPAAFLQAGADCVTATLWSIGDESAALFVGKAYAAHLEEGLPPKQATRRAALWLRDASDRELETEIDVTRRRNSKIEGFRHATINEIALSPATTPYASPFFWAAFACWGV